MIKNFFVSIILVSLSVMLVVALHEINRNDISTIKAPICEVKEKGPIYLVTYGDGEVYEANARVLADSALNNCIDVVYIYKKEHLDQNFVEKNKKILDQKRGAGYWLWKPYIMLKTMENLPENALLIYLDSGFKIVHPLDKFINQIGNYDIMLVDNLGYLNKEYTKRDLFKFMDMDNDKIRNKEQLSAGMFVLHNTKLSREFLSKWLEIGSLGWTIDDSPSKDEYPELVEHRHDQSILSLLYLQNSNGIKIADIDELLDDAWLHRRRSIDRSIYVIRDGENMQMSILGKRLDELLVIYRRLKGRIYD